MSDVCITTAPDSEIVGGMPADRLARLAARRAFVEMKQLFIRAVEDQNDRKGQWLREKVRLAVDPMDLWLLRGPVLVALQRNDRATRLLRAEFYRGMDSIFPKAFGLSGGIPTVPPAPEAWQISAATREASLIWR